MRSKRVLLFALALTFVSAAIFAGTDQALGISVDAFVMLGKGSRVEKLIGQIGDASISQESHISSNEQMNVRARQSPKPCRNAKGQSWISG